MNVIDYTKLYIKNMQKWSWTNSLEKEYW